MLKYEGVDKNFSLKGKTAIITGGASGIGHATAVFFNEKGVNLILADRNPETPEIAKSLGGNCIGIVGDVRDRSFPVEVVNACVEAFGRIDILVNNAGIGPLDDAEKVSEDDWNDTIDTNLSAAFFMAQAVGKYMIENKLGGSIVNIDRKSTRLNSSH